MEGGEEGTAVTCLAWIPKGRALATQIKSSDRDKERPGEIGEPGSDEEDLMADFPEEREGEEEGEEKQEGWDTESEGEGGDEELRDDDGLMFCCRTKGEEFEGVVYTFDSLSKGILPRSSFALEFFPYCVSPCAVCLDAGTSNFVAVAGMTPAIEIYSLDIKDEYRPEMVLGGNKDPKLNHGDVPEQFDTKLLKEGSHTDVVIAVEAHPFRPKMLASGGKDTTVKIWDLTSGQCVKTREVGEVVQQVKWSPFEAEQDLLVAACGKSIFLNRMGGSEMHQWTPDKADSITEVSWDPSNSNQCYVGMQSGRLMLYDTRNIKKPVWRTEAHQGFVNALAVSPHGQHKGLVATGGGEDNKVKLWEVDGAKPKEHLLPATGQWAAQGTGRNSIIALAFHPDDPGLLGIASETATPTVIYGLEDFGKL